MKPAIVGLSFLGLCVAGLAAIVPVGQMNLAAWFFIYLALAAGALFTWQHRQAPTSPWHWLGYCFAALGTGLVFGALDFALHGTSARSLSDFASQNPGIVLELGASLLLSFVALAGWARSLVSPRTDA